MTQNPRTNDTDGPSTNERNSSLTRRSYVRSVAVAAAAAVGAGAAATAAAAEADVIEAAGQVITIDDGESWENKLIDLTTGGDITIVAEGTDWTIRNVGFRGKNTSDTGTATFAIADTGGNTSTVENVYLGDGSTDGNQQPNGHGQTAFWVSPDHSGHLDVSRCNIQGYADNAFYGSSPAGKGDGTIHIDECYAANCYVSHYRLGTAGSKVTNSVVKCDEEGYDGRGLWAWAPGPIEVENCVFEMNGNHQSLVSRNGAVIDVSDCEYDTGANGGTSGTGISFDGSNDTDPSASILEAVPESPEAAAAGRDD